MCADVMRKMNGKSNGMEKKVKSDFLKSPFYHIHYKILFSLYEFKQTYGQM